MPFLLTRVPLVAADRTVAPAGIPVVLRVNQPVVWVRRVAWDRRPIPKATPFPAVVDTGNNYSFLIPAPFFRGWTGLQLTDLARHRTVEANGHLVGCYGFNLDLLRIRTGRVTDHVVQLLQTDRGVAVIPDALCPLFPRMPVIGVRCLRVNRLTFSVSGDKATFSLFRPAPRPPLDPG